MWKSFTWQQKCRFVVAVCLFAFIFAHSIDQQRTTTSTVFPGATRQATASKLWTFLRAHSAPARLETGMIFPRWGAQAYSNADADWIAGLREIESQTGARWISITITFHQASAPAMQVVPAADTPTPESLAEGIRAAKQHGYHVFIIPMITLDSAQRWAGYIHFTALPQAQAWFNSYWRALQPYVIVAQREGAEQFSLGNELEQLQVAPSILWQQLLDRFSQNFTGALVYCMNWTSLDKPVPTWMRDSRIAAIGVSTYVPLTTREQRLDAAQLPALWHQKVGLALDAFAAQLGKPVLLSELGYRDTAYAGYNPWQIQVNEPQDDSEQAALFNAALQNIAADTHIAGVFVWAWSFPPFAPNRKPAALVLHRWYTQLSNLPG